MEEKVSILKLIIEARWVKIIKDDRICLNKQQIDAVTYLLFNCFFTVGPKIFCQIIGIPIGSDPAPFFVDLFLYFYESKWINKLKKNDLIKARKLCNIFRIIYDWNFNNDGGESQSSYSNICPEELQLSKENTDKNEASFLNLDIKIKNEKFHFDLFDKRDSFPLYCQNVKQVK